MKYRKKPVVIEAVQWDGGDPSGELIGLALRSTCCLNYKRTEGRLFVMTLEGTMEVSSGDLVILGVQRELYPCKPDIFEATYEAVEPEATGA